MNSKHNVTQKHVLTMRIVCIIHVRLQIFYSYKIAKMTISPTPKIILCYSFQTLKLMNLSAKIYRPQYGDAGTLSRRVAANNNDDNDNN